MDANEILQRSKPAVASREERSLRAFGGRRSILTVAVWASFSRGALRLPISFLPTHMYWYMVRHCPQSLPSSI